MEFLNQREFARFLGLSIQQVRKLGLVGMPHHTKGREKQYPIPRAVQWYIAFKVEAALQRVSPDDLLAARTRKTEAEAELAELAVKKELRVLIHVDDIKPLVETPLRALAQRLNACPQRLAKRWAKKLGETEAVALALIQDLVEDTKGELRSLADEGELSVMKKKKRKRKPASTPKPRPRKRKK